MRGTSGLINRVFPETMRDDPGEATVNLWVAGIVLAALAFIVLTKRGLGGGAM